MSNFLITNNLGAINEYAIIEIDGHKASTLRGFYEELAEAMDFPEDFGYTLDSLDEMLSDLSWIEEQKIAVYISSSEYFIEKERNPEKLSTLLDMIDATCEDWKWEEDNDDYSKKELLFVFSQSNRIKELLDKQEISYRME